MAPNPPVSAAPGHTAGLSPSATRLLAEASRALGNERLDDAERALIGVLAMAPDHAEAHRMLGIVCQMRGEPAKAVEYLQQALALAPDNPVLHTNLGTALYECGQIDAALAALQRACELAPRTATSWYNLGKALKLQYRAADACQVLQLALRLDPAHTRSRITLADAQAILGDIPAAVANYREVLRREPMEPNVWFALANLKTLAFDDRDLAQLQRAFHQPGATADARVRIGFALAKACEDHRDYAAAYAALGEANALKRREVGWNAQAERNRVEQIMQAFTGPTTAPLDASPGQEAIFIVSLPRTGSTLVEQILASHPQVEGANEITDLPQVIEDESKRRGKPFPHWVAEATAADWARLGRDYLARTARWRQARPRFTDKNLVTWQYVGAIRAMLPGARIVHCHRDPLETCFACYRQLFGNGAHFSYDLDDMVMHHQDYQRLMDHWLARYPQHLLDFPHEALLADPEARIRRLLDFCGLDFDPACLHPHQTVRAVHSTASAAQVRQPLKAGVSYRERYGELLHPLRERLNTSTSE